MIYNKLYVIMSYNIMSLSYYRYISLLLHY